MKRLFIPILSVLLALACFSPLAARAAVDVYSPTELANALAGADTDITVVSLVDAGSMLTIPSGYTVTIAGGALLNIGGPLTNNGTIINNGTITSGSITNAGTITNSGTITNRGTMTNYSMITNNGTITTWQLDDSGLITGNTPITAPDAPTGVTATAGDGQVTISFTPPASDGGSAITGYTVFCAIPSGFCGISVTGTGSPITVTGLTNGTAYFFTVTANNIAGESVDSANSNTVTPMTIPDAPTNVTATAGDGQAVVSFDAPANTGGGAIINYTVTALVGGVPVGITASGAASPITVPGLANGTAYTFTVTATNAAGESVDSAASGAVTPMALPPVGSTATVPTLSQWALALLVLLMGGIVSLRSVGRAKRNPRM